MKQATAICGSVVRVFVTAVLVVGAGLHTGCGSGPSDAERRAAEAERVAQAEHAKREAAERSAEQHSARRVEAERSRDNWVIFAMLGTLAMLVIGAGARKKTRDDLREQGEVSGTSTQRTGNPR